MANDNNKADDAGKLIAISQEAEWRNWAHKLGCTVDELQAAVKAVGRSVTDVRMYLVSQWGGTG